MTGYSRLEISPMTTNSLSLQVLALTWNALEYLDSSLPFLGRLSFSSLWIVTSPQYTTTLQIHSRSLGTHNSPLKCSLLFLRQKWSFSHIDKLCMCPMCSHVLTSFCLPSAHSRCFKIHDFTFMALGGYLSPHVLQPNQDPTISIFPYLWLGKLPLTFHLYIRRT